jgi:SPP1 gp7 family putative phage head morphogenesis protein
MGWRDRLSRLFNRQMATESPPDIPKVVVMEQAIMTLLPTSSGRDTRLLRQVADQMNIVRAAINAKKRQIASLDPVVTGPDEAIAFALQSLLANPAPGMGWRQWLGLVIEDVMVLDAGVVYVWARRNGDLYALLPIDGATIEPLQDDHALRPRPPVKAYQQWINGAVHAELTDDQLLYAMMNPRTHSVYGYSPVEAVLHTTYVALRRMTGAADMMDSNIPAFFGEVPSEWTPEQIQEWQRYWDAMVVNHTNRGKWGPKGANVQFPPAHEIDTSFDEWLVHLICAVFDVQPQELGFTADVNRATGEVQERIALRRSVRPLAMLIKEIVEGGFARTGHADYQLSFPALDAKDRAEIREDAKAFIPTGVMVPNDLRADLQMEPRSGGDEPFHSGAAQPGDVARVTQRSDRLITIRRAKPKPSKTTPLDDNQTALDIEARLRDGLLGVFRRQHKVIVAWMEGIEVPGDLNVLNADDVEKWATAAITEHLGKRVRRAANAQLIQRADEEDEEWEQLPLPLLMESLKALGQVGAEAGAESLHPVVGIDWTLANDEVSRWARRYSSALVKNINDVTLTKLRDGLADWAMARETYPDLVKRFDAILNDARRADLVASTEATRAYAEGNRAIWRKAETEYGIAVQRMWLTAEDELVCPICGGLNGQVVGLDEPFTLDGAEYDFPAHPRCRCDQGPMIA